VNRRAGYSLIVAGIAVAGAAVWFVRDGDETSHQPQATAHVAPAQAEAPRQPVEPALPASERPPTQPPNVDPRVQDFEQRQRFQQQVREFFARAPALPPDERTARGQEIAALITRYEAAGEVAAAEALTLRMALVRETVADPAEQVEAIAALQDHYRQQGVRKQAEWEARANPEFELYKAREREIVAEVMSLTTIPDGLTRDEYLRRRLQQAREQLN
jgi:hypothetical protein